MAEVDYGYGESSPDHVVATRDADIDYGYGDEPVDSTSYGYGDSQPEYGYGEAQPDYGYGDSKPDDVYGYGEAKPDYDYGYGEAQPDMGYGEAQPDMGYGDAQPDMGYGDPQAAQPADRKEKRPKRRCSVTRYSIEAEACDRPLDYKWEGQHHEESYTQPPPIPEQRPETAPVQPQELQTHYADDKSTAMTESTACNSSEETDGDDDAGMLAKVNQAQLANSSKAPKTKGMLRKMRKRLSIF